MKKNEEPIFCDFKELTDIRFHHNIILKYLYAQKRGSECTAEIKQHMWEIVDILFKSNTAIALSGDIGKDALMLNETLLRVKSPKPTDQQICGGIIYV